jgi:hypothetical protein
MQRVGCTIRLIAFVGIFSTLFFDGNVRALASPRAQDLKPPESQILDLAAEKLGWKERTNGGMSVTHVVKSGEVETKYLIKWNTYTASYYYFAGNQRGLPFGETDGYQWQSGCSVSGGCNPPTLSDYFQFNFDLNYDGDGNLDTPAGRYLGYFCEVTVAAPEGQLQSPVGEALTLCTVVRDKAIQVRSQLRDIPACVGVVCPYSSCDGNTRFYNGNCDPKTGQCVFGASEDCGAAGCDPGTGKCKGPEGDACSGIVCEPAVCTGGQSYYDPVCNPTSGECEYSIEDCGAAGCEPDSGRCNRSLCGNAPCEPAQCIEDTSYYDPECVDGECQYSIEDCGRAGCNPDTGRCDQPPPSACGGSAGLALAVFLFIAMRIFRPA